jgi:hypothetical protein
MPRSSGGTFRLREKALPLCHALLARTFRFLKSNSPLHRPAAKNCGLLFDVSNFTGQKFRFGFKSRSNGRAHDSFAASSFFEVGASRLVVGGRTGRRFFMRGQERTTMTDQSIISTCIIFPT